MERHLQNSKFGKNKILLTVKERIGRQTRSTSCSMTFCSFSNEEDVSSSRNLDHLITMQSLLTLHTQMNVYSYFATISTIVISSLMYTYYFF
ncbi:hypothetical protein POUND7_003699 [Theobroma cacao]